MIVENKQKVGRIVKWLYIFKGGGLVSQIIIEG